MDGEVPTGGDLQYLEKCQKVEMYQKTALESLKQLLTNASCLRYAVFSQPFFLYTDASKWGIGSALQQVQPHNNKQHPILFISRCPSPAEKNYSASEQKCLGVC